jgi:hypothetical protein
MGIPSLNDGSIERADIDGKNRKTIVAQGVTHTPKQIILDKKGGKLYWCDREGMRVMRCNLNGSRLETLIEAGHGEADGRDQTRCFAVMLPLQSSACSLPMAVTGPRLAACPRTEKNERSVCSYFRICALSGTSCELCPCVGC